MASEFPALSSILIGDLVTPSAASGLAEYASSVVVLGDELREVGLVGLVAGYPRADPAQVELTDELLDQIASASVPAADAATLLALLDQGALVFSAGVGKSNLSAFLRRTDPGLIETAGLDDGADPGRVGISPWPALVVALLVASGVGIAAWVAWRVVSGY